MITGVIERVKCRIRVPCNQPGKAHRQMNTSAPKRTETTAMNLI